MHINTEFQQELEESGYIHRPLPLHEEVSLEQREKEKKVTARKTVWSGDGKGCCGDPVSMERGTVETVRLEAETVLAMEAPLMCRCWPEGMPQDGDCAYYGHIHAAFPVKETDWTSFHRVRALIRPECDGARTVSLSMYLENDGERKVPDRYRRQGFHMMNLKNHQWNDCIWEFPSLPRDCVSGFGFRYRINGRDTASGETAAFFVKEIWLEAVEHPGKESGWLPERNTVCYSTCGYETGAVKRAVLAEEAETFIIEDRSGRICLKKSLEHVVWKEDAFRIADFSELTQEGEYRIRAGNVTGDWFPVRDGVLNEVTWKGINFLFCERCGYPVPGKHGLCHMDVYAEHNGVKLPYCGGWHDAGDMSQQTVQTAETVESLLELAAERRGNTLLYQRLMEEALWGLEFIFRTRFGDGYRASSIGLIRWTDGKIGNDDDAANVRVHNHALENFICAGVFALAAECLRDYDGELAWRCAKAAEEDFGFALERCRTHGMELPVPWEHTYSSSAALFYGEIVTAAVRIWKVTGKEVYETAAAEYGRKLLDCQEKESSETGLRGFFYRDETHRDIVHYNHQAREHVPVTALVLLCRLLDSHSDKMLWEEGIRLYGEYVRDLMACASPYEMLPAGLYSETAEDQELFRLLHLQTDYETEKENHTLQVRAGMSVPTGTGGKSGYGVRQFPVWFSFRGNTAVMLSAAKGAAAAGGYLNDAFLMEAAASQTDWLFGKNPFGRSLMYGVGTGYQQLFSTFPGICVGQLPVGIETDGNSDVPYWPGGNQSTYKEVWVTSVAKLFAIIAEIYKNHT